MEEKLKAKLTEEQSEQLEALQKELNEKYKKTCMKNYGCENPSQSKEIKDASLQYRSSLKN
mgnify:CR=1 FL=1